MTDIVTPPTISALPPAPLATDTPTEFDAKAFALVAAQVGFVPQANAMSANVFNNATAAFERTAIAQAAASAASDSASAAASSASGAAGSASAASGSATLAGTHASTATAALTAMQVMYLGAKAVASHPTTDNMGNPLQAGALYTNTGTNVAINKRGWWWDGAAWQLAWGDITGVYMPTTGGTFTGPINVPSGATGNNAAPANEVVGRAPRALASGTDLSSLPAENGFFTVQNAVNAPTSAIWHYVIQDVHTTTSYKLQIASPLEQAGQLYYRRSIAGTWGPWAAQIDDLHVMERLKFISLPTETTYTANPAEASIHYVSIYNAVQFTIPTGRQLGDQLTIRVYSNSGVRPITFSSNVALPKNQTMPTYAANDIVTFTLIYGRTGIWDLFYAGVHAG